MLDPLARQDFMATVMTAMADDGVSVLLSSHALAELERVADYLVLLSEGELRVADEVDDLLSRHRVLTGPAAEADRYARQPRSPLGTQACGRCRGSGWPGSPGASTGPR